MSCLGVHFAITAEEASAIEHLDDEQDRLFHLQEVIEEQYFENQREYIAESDHAWDAMHRSLADGTLDLNGGVYPLNHTVLAGKLLYTGDDYIMSLKSPKDVESIAQALTEISESEFRDRYNRIDTPTYQGELSEEDFQYTWDSLQGVRELYSRAASEGRYVLFTADQ
ncbi:hypothetical protein IP80_21000 [beta proteobacterium AAP65]|nr:hypothetical protein IP80_21000 [beta proteobacterium AAP65]